MLILKLRSDYFFQLNNNSNNRKNVLMQVNKEVSDFVLIKLNILLKVKD